MEIAVIVPDAGIGNTVGAVGITAGSDLFLLLVTITLDVDGLLGINCVLEVARCENLALESNGLVGGAVGVTFGINAFTCCFFAGVIGGNGGLMWDAFGVGGGLIWIFDVGGWGFYFARPLLTF